MNTYVGHRKYVKSLLQPSYCDCLNSLGFVLAELDLGRHMDHNELSNSTSQNVILEQIRSEIGDSYAKSVSSCRSSLNITDGQFNAIIKNYVDVAHGILASSKNKSKVVQLSDSVSECLYLTNELKSYRTYCHRYRYMYIDGWDMIFIMAIVYHAAIR